MITMMHVQRSLLLLVATASLAVHAFAQQKRIALINSDAFMSPTGGILRLVRVMENAEREFEPRRRELMKAQDELQRYSGFPGYGGPIPTDPRPMTPERKKKIQGEIKALTEAFEKRQRQTQASFERRMKEVRAPVYADIQQELQRFVAERRIELLINASSLECFPKCDPKITESLDVTREFIEQFNRRHP